MMKVNPVPLSDSDWKTVSTAIPGFEEINDPDTCRSKCQALEVLQGSVLPPDGMYVVLEGAVSLQLNEQEIATAGPADYFFEEHLVIDHPLVELTARCSSDCRLMYLSRRDWSGLPGETQSSCFLLLFGDLVRNGLLDFQQPINCCNITAAALSLTALGFTCDVNDIFEHCALPVSYVVNDGMTLGELYDVASSYVYAAGLRDEVGVELYHFDEALVCKQDLRDAIEESGRLGGASDSLVANFDVGIAHGNPAISGGHFALIAKCNQSTGLVHMMDVHPEKYGKIWVTSIDRLFEAMVDHDSSAMRGRGMLRFIIKKDVKVRLDALANSECYPENCTQYIDLTPEKRRHIFSRSSTNLNSFCVLSMGLGILDNHPVDVDEILGAAQLTYTEALSFETTTEQLARFANDYLSHAGINNLACSLHSFADSNEESAEVWLKKELLTIAKNPKAYLMVNIDYNSVIGFSSIHSAPNQYRETPLLKEYWCVCVDYLFESDTVILADMNSATSQVWRAPRENLFRGLKEQAPPALLYLNQVDSEENPLEFEYLITNHDLVLFYNDDDPWSYMLKSVLENIGVTELHPVDVSGFDLYTIGMRKKLSIHSGKEKAPYLYLKGRCLGEVDDIMNMVREGTLQTLLQKEGLPVLMRQETPSLDNNIFSYPKGGLTEPPNGKHNILLCACGSSAADKIPELIERLIDAGHNVKLVPTPSSEVFFKDVGMDRILKKLRPSDIYRDDDEWNFRYTEFGMPIRAAHLALCDWADCVVVAPITCNTMAKVAHGTADNLLGSVFVAWQYQRKPVIFCPACNTNMWNNLTTQNNVAMLKRLGAHIEGPRSGILSNGRMGTGMMATSDEIMGALEHAFKSLDDPAQTVMRWGRAASASGDHREWGRIYRAIDEGVVGINIIEDENGDSLLHFASGGSGELDESGIEKGKPDLPAMRELLKRGIHVDLRNNYYFSALHVAAMNGTLEAVDLLLDAGADCTECLAYVKKHEVAGEIKQRIEAWAEEHEIQPPEESVEEPYVDFQNEAGELFFTYGSLKRGFPNHDRHADILCDFVATSKTRQSFPLVVPDEPSCDNPNCPYLHRMAALVDIRGLGYRVRGEVYRIKPEDLATLDALEGFKGEKLIGNVYERKKITILLQDEICQAYTYFIADPDAPMDAVEARSAEMVSEYTLDMAVGELKPGFEQS
jgi:phosphopantothenoylcysteine synthetase/decarboxylase/gamma-glutamylcyclotransferase (GGCT)/AIG2-like uncharacterized protein YtfP/glutaredoxin-related protein